MKRKNVTYKVQQLSTFKLQTQGPNWSGFLKILWRLEALKVAFAFKVAMIQ